MPVRRSVSSPPATAAPPSPTLTNVSTAETERLGQPHTISEISEVLHGALSDATQLDTALAALGGLFHDIGEGLGNAESDRATMDSKYYIGVGCLLEVIGREAERISTMIDECCLALSRADKGDA